MKKEYSKKDLEKYKEHTEEVKKNSSNQINNKTDFLICDCRPQLDAIKENHIKGYCVDASFNANAASIDALCEWLKANLLLRG